MSAYLVKQKEDIAVVRPTNAQIYDNVDQWLPFMETIFFVKEKRLVEMEFYLVNSNLQPRVDYQNDQDAAVLGIRVLLQTGSQEISLANQEFRQNQTDALKTLQVSDRRELDPGFYVLVAQINLKGGSTHVNGDMKLEAQKAYFAVAGLG